MMYKRIGNYQKYFKEGSDSIPFSNECLYRIATKSRLYDEGVSRQNVRNKIKLLKQKTLELKLFEY